jgi:pimeloyl-ACP methyl ester carboxylesterase
LAAVACRSRRVPLPGGLGCHLLEWGGEDPVLDHTVLLLHGMLENAWAWEETVEAGLAGRFHVVAADFRGHGDSDRVGGGAGYYLPDYLADLHELIPLVARGRLSLVGHSLGGAIAGLYAGTCPERISGLVLIEGTGLPTTVAGPPRMAQWLEGRARVRARPQRSYGSLDEAAQRLRDGDPELGPERALRLAEKGTDRGPDGRLRFKHDPRLTAGRPCAFDVENARRFWANVRCPVLIVEGAQSDFRLPEEEGRRRWSSFARWRSVVVPATGHMVPRHQPQALARLLVDFLSEAPEPR